MSVMHQNEIYSILRFKNNLATTHWYIFHKPKIII